MQKPKAVGGGEEKKSSQESQASSDSSSKVTRAARSIFALGKNKSRSTKDANPAASSTHQTHAPSPSPRTLRQPPSVAPFSPPVEPLADADQDIDIHEQIKRDLDDTLATVRDVLGKRSRNKDSDGDLREIHQGLATAGPSRTDDGGPFGGAAATTTDGHAGTIKALRDELFEARQTIVDLQSATTAREESISKKIHELGVILKSLEEDKADTAERDESRRKLDETEAKLAETEDRLIETDAKLAGSETALAAAKRKQREAEAQAAQPAPAGPSVSGAAYEALLKERTDWEEQFKVAENKRRVTAETTVRMWQQWYYLLTLIDKLDDVSARVLPALAQHLDIVHDILITRLGRHIADQPVSITVGDGDGAMSLQQLHDQSHQLINHTAKLVNDIRRERKATPDPAAKYHMMEL